jgi:hypothetical protein
VNPTQATNCPLVRREFLSKLAAAGTSLCFTNSLLLSQLNAQEKQDEKSFKNNIAKDSDFSYEKIFTFAFKALIAQLESVSKVIGRDKLIELLTNATDEAWFSKDVQKAFNASLDSNFWKNALELKVLEESNERRVYKITNCLWAKTFRDENAGDIGYALWCHSDYAVARSNNEEMIRPKCLMKGDDCCHIEWTKKV